MALVNEKGVDEKGAVPEAFAPEARVPPNAPRAAPVIAPSLSISIVWTIFFEMLMTSPGETIVSLRLFKPSEIGIMWV